MALILNFLITLIFLPVSLASSCQSHFLSSNATFGNFTRFFDPALVVVPALDSRYDELKRHTNNRRFNSDAAVIAIPKNASEVLSILRVALARNLRPTIRSGGHCYEDFWSNNTGGVLIDLSAMNRIYRLPGDQTVWVESGATSQRFYDVLFKEFGLTAPGARSMEVAVGGHVAGGGYGYLARPYGLIIDYVDSMEIAYVTQNKTANLIQVGRNSANANEKNLFWALRGGGSQNFGVITKIGLKKLPKSPPLVYRYQARFILNVDLNRSMLLDYLDRYTKFMVDNSSGGNENCDMYVESLVGRKNDGKARLDIFIMAIGKRELATNFIASMGLNESKFTCDELSYYRLLQTSSSRDDVTREGDYYVQRSAYMVGPMPRQQQEAIWKYMTDPSYSFVVDGFLQIRSYGCSVGRVAETETAYPHRNAVIKIQYGTWWQKREDADRQWRWSREFYKAMYGENGPKPDKIMDGCFVNYPDGELKDWQHLYFKNNYEKLMLVKQQWDPLNIFHHRQSIELPRS